MGLVGAVAELERKYREWWLALNIGQICLVI